MARDRTRSRAIVLSEPRLRMLKRDQDTTRVMD
jgi:hypothetical protein